MPDQAIYVLPETAISGPLVFDEQRCVGCNLCVEVCQVDLMIPNPEKGATPIVLYPGECWYCGCCVMACPEQGAITLQAIPMNRVYWKTKDDIDKLSSP